MQTLASSFHDGNMAVNIQGREDIATKGTCANPSPEEKKGLSWILGMLVEWVAPIKELLDLLFWWYL